MEEIHANLPEHFTCPICFEIPKDKVFQCRNGHTVCESCYGNFAERRCPQCRVYFPRNPIRCRAMEQMLDSQKPGFPCEFQGAGCDVIFGRKWIAEHISSCKFNFAKFGEFKNVCGLFGFKNCSFSFNRASICDALEHFQLIHKMRSKKALLSNSICLHFKTFAEILKSPESIVFSPLILNQKWWGHDYVYIIVARYNSAEKMLLLTPFYLPHGNPEEKGDLPKTIKFTVSGLEGILKPEHLLFCEGQTLPDSCHFGVPLSKIFPNGEVADGLKIYAKIELDERYELPQDGRVAVIKYKEDDILTMDLLEERWPAFIQPVNPAGIEDWESQDWSQFRWIASQDYKHCSSHLVPAFSCETAEIFICRANINDKWLIGAMQIDKEDNAIKVKIYFPDLIGYDQVFRLDENYEILYTPPGKFEWMAWHDFKKAEAVPVPVHDDDNNLLICQENMWPFLNNFGSIKKDTEVKPDEFHTVSVLVFRERDKMQN